MPGSGVQGQVEVAEQEVLAVAHDPVHRDGRKGLVQCRLRIAPVEPACLERAFLGGSGGKERAGQPLQFGQPAYVVVVLMAGDYPLYVLKLETERLDVVGNQARSIGRAAIKQDMTL